MNRWISLKRYPKKALSSILTSSPTVPHEQDLIEPPKDNQSIYPKNVLKRRILVLLSLPGCLVENYRPGYPRFAALTASHPAFRICRRFSSVRMRLLYAKQDEISVLEEKLNAIDNQEKNELFLGNVRRDNSLERKDVLSKLEHKLIEYGVSSQFLLPSALEDAMESF